MFRRSRKYAATSSQFLDQSTFTNAKVEDSVGKLSYKSYLLFVWINRILFKINTVKRYIEIIILLENTTNSSLNYMQMPTVARQFFLLLRHLLVVYNSKRLIYLFTFYLVGNCGSFLSSSLKRKDL